jgi:uncharacterized membrane protein
VSGATAERVAQHGPESASMRVAVLARERVWTLSVVGAMVVWTATLLAIAYQRHAEFRFARYDLGNMVQAVWSTAHGHVLEVTEGQTGDQLVRLAFHVDPILALLAPAWIAFPSPVTLIAIQVVAVAAGALPVYWLARRHTGSPWVGALLALTYLAYPWTAWIALDAFHPVAVAIPLLLFCVWFLDSDRLLPFAVCAVLVAGTGELMALTVAALGLWYALARGRRRAGAVIAGAGLVWTAVALAVVVPAFLGGESPFYGDYEKVGGSPAGVLRTAVTDPLAIVSEVTHGNDVLYVVLLSLPLGGLFVLSPGLALVALPQLAANLLAGREHVTDPHVHYVAGILPFLFAATAVGLGRLSHSSRVKAVTFALTLSVAFSIALGPWPRSVLGASAWDTLGTLDTSAEHVGALERAVALVPDGAAVSTTNRLGSHLSDRRYVYSAPVLGRAEWVVLDTTDTWIPVTYGGGADPHGIAALRDRLEADPGWRKVFSSDDVYVFRRVKP